MYGTRPRELTSARSSIMEQTEEVGLEEVSTVMAVA